MHILSLEVHHWRGLEEVRLEGFSEGINVIEGENESGKSRLFEALQFAFFESHAGRAKKKRRLQGWQSTESPRVALELEVTGERYRLEKAFLKGAFARLEGGGRVLADHEAEEALRRLLGLAGDGRGDLPAERRGLWPLLWLEQGESRRPPQEDLNPEPRSRLQDLLAAEVGEIAGGSLGHDLLERAAAERGRYLTPTGRPTGELRKSRQELAEAERELEEARSLREEARELADELDRVRAAAAEGDAEAGRLAEGLEAERDRLAEAEGLAAEIELSSTRIEGLELRRKQAEEKLDRHTRAAARSRELGESIAEAEAGLADAGRRLGTAAEELTVLQEGRQLARTALEEARREEERSRRRERRRQLASGVERLAADLQRARALATEIEKGEKDLRGLQVEAVDLDRLEVAEQQSLRASARLEGAASRLEIHALADLCIEEEELPAGRSRKWRVTEALTVELAGLARIEVFAGGEAMGALRREAESAAGGLERALAAAGVRSVAEGRKLLRQGRRSREDLEHRRRQLAELAPRGEASLAAELEEASRELSSLGPEESGAADSGEAAAVSERALEDLGRAQAEIDRCSERLETLRGAEASARVELAALRARAEGVQAELASSASEEGESSLEESLGRADRALGEALRIREAQRARYEAMGGEVMRRQRKSLEGEHERLLSEVSRIRRKEQQLAARLEVRGGEDLHGRVQNARSRQEEAAERHRILARRARAAERLHECLTRHRDRSQERLTGPVRQRVAPYLRELFPASDLAIDEHWRIQGLETGDAIEGFSDLSGGAQEQLGILVRIALAEILAREERLPLILDDALVHTDARRRQAFSRVLEKAAERLQIILLTCHGSSFGPLDQGRRFRLPARR